MTTFDPLVYGVPELREDIPLLNRRTTQILRRPTQSTVQEIPPRTSAQPNVAALSARHDRMKVRSPNTTEGDIEPNVVPPKVMRVATTPKRIGPELTAEDWNDHAEHVAFLKAVEYQRGLHRRLERQARREDRSKQSQRRSAAVGHLSVVSERTKDDAQNISQSASRSNTPHICLVGAQQLDTNMLLEWCRFCKNANSARMMHSEQGTDHSRGIADYRVLVFNRRGDVVVFERLWLDRIFQERRLHALYAMAMLDTSSTLLDLSTLAEQNAVFVYDPSDDASCDLMLKWQCGRSHHVCPIGESGQCETCVIKRENQMFRKYNIA